MPKLLLWFIAIALAGIFYVLWDAGKTPARVTVMNQSGAVVRDVVITTDHESVAVGALRPGESRASSVRATERVEVTYAWGQEKRQWRAIEPLRAGQPLVLYVTGNGRIAPRSGIGAQGR